MGEFFPAEGYRFPTSEDMKSDVLVRLENGVKELFETDQYKEFLKTMSKFHDYSLNNCILISMQCPEATRVAGFRAWQEKFERTVKKGEKGIRIISPRIRKEEVKDKNGNSKVEERISFGIGVVFDAKQTEGKEIVLDPFLIREENGFLENFEEIKEALTITAGIPISFKEDLGGASGFFRRNEKDICIKSGMTEIDTISTLIHEIAHSRLHADIKPLKERKATRGGLEVEAESVSFVVSEYFGIDTSQSSFGYVASWSKGKELPELKGSLDIIRRESSEMIRDIEQNLLKGKSQSRAMQEEPSIKEIQTVVQTNSRNR